MLLFLLVNERCYASQIHRLLGVPLTPLQKALERLEKGGILQSTFAGKTKVFQLNSNYLLIGELESLLKKAYGALSAHEKKEYYFVGYDKQQGDHRIILTLWERLKEISRVRFTAKSHSKGASGWKGRGQGDVVVSFDGDSKLIFHEEGVRSLPEQEFHFTNTFRWQLHRIDGLIGLEHLRFGAQNPVFMFHLRQSGHNSFESLHSHVCQEDTYFGSLHLEAHEIKLTWRIIGPKKNEELEYFYS